MFEYRARILRVIDGDTVEAEIDLGFRVSLRATLRLAGIDTPELRGPTREAGRAATDYLELLLSKLAGPERQVTVRTQKDRTGKYGRYLADLVVGGRSLNEALVLAGHARPMED